MPVEIAHHNVVLVILDLVCAEFDRGPRQSPNMSARCAELVPLGMPLHNLAALYSIALYSIAVVVANHVVDRFPSCRRAHAAAPMLGDAGGGSRGSH